jgi:hypothetical protein
MWHGPGLILPSADYWMPRMKLHEAGHDNGGVAQRSRSVSCL